MVPLVSIKFTITFICFFSCLHARPSNCLNVVKFNGKKVDIERWYFSGDYSFLNGFASDNNPYFNLIEITLNRCPLVFQINFFEFIAELSVTNVLLLVCRFSFRSSRIDCSSLLFKKG